MASLKPLGMPYPLRTAGMVGGISPGMPRVWHEEEEKKEKEKEKEGRGGGGESKCVMSVLRAALGNVSTKISHLHTFLFIWEG